MCSILVIYEVMCVLPINVASDKDEAHFNNFMYSWILIYAIFYFLIDFELLIHKCKVTEAVL